MKECKIITRLLVHDDFQPPDADAVTRNHLRRRDVESGITGVVLGPRLDKEALARWGLEEVETAPLLPQPEEKP